jgi:hypothetical protein
MGCSRDGRWSVGSTFINLDPSDFAEAFVQFWGERWENQHGQGEEDPVDHSRDRPASDAGRVRLSIELDTRFDVHVDGDVIGSSDVLSADINEPAPLLNWSWYRPEAKHANSGVVELD